MTQEQEQTGPDRSRPSEPFADAARDVVAGVIVRNDRLLACRRRATDAHPGQWEFPGGKREAGETLPAALRRELLEELGIDATVGAPLWSTRHRYAGHPPIALHFFHVPNFSGALVNRVFAEIRWVALAELASLDFLAADRDFLSRLVRGDVRLPAVALERAGGIG